ncbi:SurA N-terminal domain-containing protein [Aquisalimonas asiatica]|uniref:Periplasmic chaperone PpiD n=1 Tax=Aquisalimonas asiatica TaxID=406100 RepID=A0A1H8QYE0_9GAMM|nr:SurA N-terminal domain-containing protein [Aquisalimonas asiatica]SEO59027.1 peptidyl-prolyl cis-trans isomerase D [Aquisalimonas asiatica]
MLQSIRDRATGWIAWVVIILIGSAFALFGLSNYMEPGGTPRAVATVNGSDISRDEVGRAYRNQRQQIEQAYGDDLEITDEIDRQIRRDALERLINQRLVADYIDDRNMTVSDQDLAAIIRSQEVFHEGGRFSQERYQAVLRANQMNSAQYEQHVRQDALAQQVRAAFTESGLVTEREVDDLLRLQMQERDVAWLRLDNSAWHDDVEVSDDDIQAYYDEHRDTFVTEERVRLAYVELRREDLIDGVDVSDEEIETRYEQVRDERYTEDREVEARHILIRVDEDADDDTVSEAQERAEALRQRITDGESFAELAEEYSDDPASGARGGDLGRVERGDMVEPFEDALFALEEGELSEPVRSPFGIHLIEATTSTGGEVTPLDEVRDELRREIAEEQVSNEFFDDLNRLDELAFDSPDTLDDAAEGLGLEIHETDWITREGGDGIASEPEVLEAAFDREVLEDRMNSAVIELGDDRAVVVRVSEHEPQEQLELDEVRDEIEARVRDRKAAEAAEAFADEIMERIRAGESPAEIASEDDRVSFEDIGWVNRQEGGAPGQVLRTVFGMVRPENDTPSLERILAANDPVILVLRGVRDGDAEGIDAEERRELAERLRESYGDEAVEQFLAQLRADADVEVHDDDYR